MPDELKPCPFCGGKAKKSKQDMIIQGKSERCAWVYCTRCNARTGYQIRSKRPNYMNDAEDAWNRRVGEGEKG